MKKFFILWSPESSLPPRKRWDTEREAKDVAVIMAERYPSQTFVVCEAKSISSVRPVAAQTVRLR